MDPHKPQNQSDDPNAYLLPTNKLKAVLQPLGDSKPSGEQPKPVHPAATGADLAADVIRSKIQALYVDEPDVRAEMKDADAAMPRSKHQQFMHELSSSGRPLPEIQTRWHEYYTALPDSEKHEVWQEFYTLHATAAQQKQAPAARNHTPTAPRVQAAGFSQHQFHQSIPADRIERRSVADIKNQLTNRIKQRTRTPAKQHFQSLIFGLATGSVVLIILLFGFFNERFIAPFITPGRNVSATPIIIDPGSTAVGKESKVIIPKINVEIPVVYDEPSIEESAIQRALERGVVHYATTSQPGELGNSVIFGHSSNNILNQGKYKFAFVLLSKLNPGDTFYLTKDGTRYAYRVFDKKVVGPADFSVLEPVKGKPATATLITCDPPGTSINRLVVTAEQITPDPNANVASSAQKIANQQPKIIPGNAPSLWNRLTSWLTG
jgi:sortase A